jgi:tripartite-type tricarboxylate transporter receptor subunit TctC
MKLTNRFKPTLLAIGTMALLASGAVLAQDYPNQVIRLVVPWPPGGATDAIGRLIGQSLTERLGQQVIIDNKPGAGGNIGTEQFVRSAKPDGYTLLMATSSTNAANPHLYSRLGFNPAKDFAPVAFVAAVPNIMVVPVSSPFNTIGDLLAQTRATPGKLTYASAGVGSSQHLAGSMLKSAAKIDILHVPYKGSGPAATDLIGSHVDMMLDTGSMPHIRGHKLKALAVASKTRLPMLPNVPTFDESGVRGMYASAWYGVMAPAGTPQAIVDRLNAEINKAVQEPKTKKLLQELGAEIGGGSAKEFAEFVNTEITRYGTIVKMSGAKLE